MKFYERLKGLREFDILSGLDKVYQKIERRQRAWKKSVGSLCPDGCGNCCIPFEPHVYDCEAMYMAMYLIACEPAAAKAIRDGSYPMQREDNDKGCFLFDPQNEYHCTVYGGRALICRMFGYCGDRGKDGNVRWKPCRHLSEEFLSAHEPPLEHKEYDSKELLSIIKVLPPSMNDFMEEVLSLDPGKSAETRPLRQALPEALRRLQFLLAYAKVSPSDDGDDDNTPPNSPPEPISA